MVSTKSIWAGRILSGLVALLLAFDAVMKIALSQVAVDGTVQLGYPAGVVRGLGIALLGSVILYAIPRTSLIGAILVTGYLGGAVATHVRVGDPWLSHILAPVYVAVMIWGGLVLRETRLRSLVLSGL
ncbi:MAG TPA: DoxX family protein [Bryobacteraceae bacterium]|jgi:hypothetical protein